MLNPLETPLPSTAEIVGAGRQNRGGHYRSAAPVPMTGSIFRVLDPVCIVSAGLLAAFAYIHWTTIGTTVSGGVGFERMALLAAVVAPFILYEPRFRAAASRGSVALLVSSHLLRFALFTVAVLALGQLSYILIGIPRTVVALWLGSSLALTSLSRVLMARYVRLLQRRGALTEVIAVVGAGPVADRLVLAMRQTRPDSVALLGVFDDATPVAGSMPRTGTIDDLLELGKTRRIDWILLTTPPTAENDVLSLVNRLKALSVPIGLCPQHIGAAVPLRRVDCVANAVPVSVLLDRPSDWIERLQTAAEALLPRWVVTLSMLPLHGLREFRHRVVAVPQRRPERSAPVSLVIDNYSAIEFGAIAAKYGQDKFGYVVTPNADHVIHLHENASFRRQYEKASYVLLDSQFLAHLVRLTRRLRLPVCTGSDMTGHLLAKVVAADDRVVLIGGSDAQARALAERYGMRGLVHHNPPMGFIRDSQAVEACLQFVESHSPFRFCLLAVGSPQQEFIAHELRVRGAARGLALCVGASIDFLTGAQRRAPLWMQRRGLEWLYRLLRSPGRLAHRYLIRGPRVFALMRGTQLRLRMVPTLQPRPVLRLVR